MAEYDQDRPVVAVTGASAGVGRAVALAFARRGATVALMSRRRERLDSAAREVEAAGGLAMVESVDVSDAAAVEAAAARIASVCGRIDVWINCAMVTVFAPVRDLRPDEVRRVTEVTYLGQVHGTLAALRHMRPRDSGTIVQVGSALAYCSIPLQSAYCAAKAAVRGFTDSLRSELIHERSGVRVTMIQLPGIDTPQFDWARSRLPRQLQPVPPIYDPEAVAERIVKAAATAPRELWIGTSAMKAILGTFAAPGMLDRMMADRAWDGQMTRAAAEPRADNLFDAPAGDPGAHGRFAARERHSVSAVSGDAARWAIGLAGVATAVGVTALAYAAGRRATR
ncbi:MAG: SDR family oxidoreductase [Geminicoccaceae bacterium]